MRTFSLGFSLFWRLLAFVFILGLCLQLVLVFLSALNIEVIPDQLATSALYIKMKSSLAYVVIAIILALVRAAFKINLIYALWGKRLSLSSLQWQTALIMQVALLFVLALANVLVATLFSTTFWVNYKLLGGFSLLSGHLIVAYMLLRSARQSVA
ncbi:MAG: hypothetical protein HOP04_01440 [Methylophilaceae bacterium]|nr:hypothetical protein [Methylophilaceae bacterium]